MENTKNGKMNKALLMGTALISLSAINATEVQAAAGTGAMSAVILTPITVAGTQALHFGSMTHAGVGGTMVMDTANTRTAAGVVAVVGGAAEQSGQISMTGATGVAINLSMAATAYTVSDGGGQTMGVNNFQLRTNAGGTLEVITMVASPTVIPLGATLTVGAAQVAGTYTGAYTLNANYQ